MPSMTTNKMIKPSFRARLISSILKLLNVKKQLEKQVINNRLNKTKKEFVPKKIMQQYSVVNRTVDTKSVATFETKQGGTNTHLILLHGGAYLFEAGMIHWTFAQKIVDKINCKMTLIDYPLAPEHDYKMTYAMVQKSYQTLTEQYPNDDFMLIGDSAGAGLAMGFYQQLQIEKVEKLPSKIILLSPWLDLTMTNPEAKKYESTDYLLTIKMLQTAASYYAKGDDQSQYLLSPINGDLTNFPPTYIFYSDTELFCADCRKLRSMVRDNRNFVFNEYHKMQHDWAMFPISESNRVVEEICGFIG